MDTKQALLAFEQWYRYLKIVKVNNGPANGTIAAALVVLENLKKNYDLNFESHIAPGGAQIKNTSGSSVAAILKQFGEIRPFSKEGGRTNRGLQRDLKPLFPVLAGIGTGIIDRFGAKRHFGRISTFFSCSGNRLSQSSKTKTGV